MEEKTATLIIDLLCHQLQSLDRQSATLAAILKELQAIREAAETEAVEDADPEPFQTLNGPKTISGDGHSTVFSYPEGTTISEP